MNVIIKLCLVATLAFSLAGEGIAMENFVYPPEIAAWGEAEKNQQAIKTVEMLEELQRIIKAGGKSYTIKPGNYRFGSQPGRARNLELKQVKDFIINAEGVTFWIDATFRQDAVVLRECSNVTIRGLTIDCNPFSYSQGEIMAIDRSARTLTVKLDPGFPRLETWTAGGNMKAAFFDKKNNFAGDWLDYVASFEAIDNEQYRIKLKNNYIFIYDSVIEPGYRMAFPDRSKRMAFNMLQSEKCILENITVYNAPQMAFTEHGGKGGHHYRTCRVMRRPGTRRLITCNADLFHSIKTEVGPTIENCDFAWSCDDLINIHGLFSYVVANGKGDELLIVQSMLPEDWTGREIEFFDGENMKRIAMVKVIAMTPVTDAATVEAAGKMPAELRTLNIGTTDFMNKALVFKIKLDRSVDVKKFDVIQSYGACGSRAVIRGNKLHDTLARGLLIRGESALVENNEIKNTGYNGIQALSDWYFMESSIPCNLTIRNNTLINCANGLHGRIEYSLHIAAINTIICHRSWRYAPGISPIRNLVIENNRIIDSGVIGIAVGNAENARVVDNLIDHPFANGFVKGINRELKMVASGIYVVESHGTDLRGNKITNLPDGVKDVVYGPGATK